LGCRPPPRQRAAIKQYALANGIRIVREFREEGVSDNGKIGTYAKLVDDRNEFFPQDRGRLVMSGGDAHQELQTR
jgi:hypothetical protein